VVAIIGILASLAYPSYMDYVRRAHRADARAGLLAAQQWMERAATATGTYPAALPAALTLENDTSKRYTISLVTSDDKATYTLTATPNTAAQSADPCGPFTLTNTGEQGSTGPVAECWGK